MDYYGVLGLEKTATAAEIKKAYRKLALEHHPDRNQGPGAEAAAEKMRELNEAYSVLSDENKRASYDRFGLRDRSVGAGPPPDMAEFLERMGMRFSGFGFSGFGPPPHQTGPQQGADVTGQLQVSLAEAILGATRVFEMTFNDYCPDCAGRGFTRFDKCEECKGRGQVVWQQGNAQGIATCRACGGVGEFPLDPCSACVGKKTVPVSRRFEVGIPAGVYHGATLRLRGQGHTGLNGGPPGDVLLRVRVQYPAPESLSEEQAEFLRKISGDAKAG